MGDDIGVSYRRWPSDIAREARTLRDGQRWRPLVPQDVEADRAVRVDIRVVDLGREADLGRLEGVVGWERNGEEEHAAGVRRVALQR